MRRLLTLFMLVSSISGGSYVFFNKDRIHNVQDVLNLFKNLASRRASSSAGGGGYNDNLPVSRNSDTIRIASFNIQVLGQSKLSKPKVMDVLARVCRNFDIVAIQEIRSSDQSVMPQFVDLINATGRHYDYVISPRIGRTVSKEQYAYVYDRASIEVDRNQLYVVDDPDDMLHREPMVGWFRVRGPTPEHAFTFSLVNIHTDPDEVKTELNVLDDVMRIVRDDGRGEDDVILLGDLNVDNHHMGELGMLSGTEWVIADTPTNTRGTKQYDNIVFQGYATQEFSGRGGVYDFFKEYNMTLQEALEVSDHLPVWAEFSIYEGGVPGRVASNQQPAMPR